MNAPEYPDQVATVTVSIGGPDLVGAAFETVHNVARAYDMSDIEMIDVTMKVIFRGSPAPFQLEAFKAQINRLWMAQVTHLEVEPPAEESKQ